MHACMLHACVRMRVHLCVRVCMYVCVSVRACSCVCVRVHVCVCVHVRVYMHVRQAENQMLAKEVATLQHLHHPSQQQSNGSALSCLSHTYLSIHICIHTMFQGAYMCIYILFVYTYQHLSNRSALSCLSYLFKYTHMRIYIIYVYVLCFSMHVCIYSYIYLICVYIPASENQDSTRRTHINIDRHKHI